MTSSAASSGWFIWTPAWAVFAELTAIFAKFGLGGVNCDMATLNRTATILGVRGAFVCGSGRWTNPFAPTSGTWPFLVLSGLPTCALWTATSGN